MHYQIREVTQRAELDGVVDVWWAAMDGVEPWHAVLFPTFGSDAHAKEDAKAKSKERLWNSHAHDSASHWIYAQEVKGDLGRIIGGCQWRLYEESPFGEGGPKRMKATWWPDGPGRMFASEVVSQCYAPRQCWMARPHAGLSFMCVLPELQRRGVGAKLMEWGLERIDHLNTEGFIEATVSGRQLYQRFGFKPVAIVRVSLDQIDTEKKDRWVELERTLLPH